MSRRIAAVLAVLLLLSAEVWAQQSFGSITGSVTDPQGARVPGAAVVVTNKDTNRTSKVVTNDSGYFEANLLDPGSYSISVEVPGFKRALRANIDLSVAGRLEIPVQLELGQTADTVQVTAEAPMLDTTSASGGRVINNRQIMQLPFSDMNPFALATLAPGMQWTGQPEYRRPFDNGGTSSFNTAGGVGQNEYTIDGAPATGTGRRVGFVPPSDAVEEFRLETATFDASYGHTSGATVNVMSKAGTNTYHGSLYDQHWQQRWNATQHFTRLQYEAKQAAGTLKPGEQKQASGRSNNYGATLGGPVRIPKVFNGKDKLFFFLSYNGIKQSKAETTDAVNRTVPKEAWRNGDFSDLLAIDPVKYQIYDPRTARLENGRVVRDPFPGNKGIPVLNPMYKFYAPLYPLPNNVPGLVNAEGRNNYYAAAMPKNENFFSIINRVDYNFAQNHRVFGRWYWNDRLADEYDWTYETARGLHANGLTRINKGAGGDWIWTVTANTVLDLGVNYTRFNEGSRNATRTAYAPSDVGLPSYLDARVGSLAMLPSLDFNQMEDFSTTYPYITDRGSTAEVKLQITSVFGAHSLKYGYNERRYQFSQGGPGYNSGRIGFSSAYMKQSDSTNTASDLGLEWAAFMMGVPSYVSVEANDSAVWSTPWRALYVNDDWRLSNRIRVTLGLRFEHEGGTTERYNRGLGNFDYNLQLPISAAAEAAYAANPIPGLPASQFKVIGGNTYLNAPNKAWTKGVNNFIPRLGLVYTINDKTVVRTGYGVFYDTFNVNNDRPIQDGFSQATSTPITNDLGLTFCCGVGAASSLSATNNPLVDPFPVRANGTRFDTAYGNSLDGMIRVGRNFKYIPYDYQPARQQRWRFGIQRQIRNDVVVEASYNGAFSRFYLNGDTDIRRTVSRVDYLPEQYWAKGNTRNDALDNDLNLNVANPFYIGNFGALQTSNPALYNYMNTQGFFTSKTIRKNQLLRAYPQMNGLWGVRPGTSTADSMGRNLYHDFQFQAEKRFARGFQTAVMYTYARGSVADFYVNEWDTSPAWRPNNNVRPHRFVWTAIYDLPFGKGRQFLTNNPLQHVLGGWTLSWVYQRQSGPATAWSNTRNLFFYGDIDKLGDLFRHDQVNSADIHQWFDPSIAYRGPNNDGKGTDPIPAGFTGFEGRSALQPGTFQARYFPTFLTSLREDGIRNWDVKVDRKFRITEGLRTSFAVDLLNATNHTNFGSPETNPTSTNFGRVTSQRGLSRIIQLNLRVDF